MTKKERTAAVIAGRKPDRTAVLGGWIASPDMILALTGATQDEYWADPVAVSVRAYMALENDALMNVFVPKKGTYRCVDERDYRSASGSMSLEEAVAHIEARPDGVEMEAAFDEEAAYADFRRHLQDSAPRMGDMAFLPTYWEGAARITWFQQYGYENFFLIIGLYPQLLKKLCRIGGSEAVLRNRLVARAYREGLYPGATLFGEDICTQRGPMVSPELLREVYAPELTRGLQPLLDAGVRPVWHCDGDVRAIMPMLLECGIRGFQGFQPECGVTLDYILSQRLRDGGKPLVFGPMAVTTELPVMTPAQVKARVAEVIAACRDRADLFLFTSNTINPDIPLDNLIAMRDAAQQTPI